MVVFHGSKEVVSKPEIRVAKFTKDFSTGFYCTALIDQSKRWAIKLTGKGIVNKYCFNENNNLKIKRFEKMDDEWLEFIVSCRRGINHNYDIVEGPMADDQIYNFIQNYIDGTITKEAFWLLVKFNKPTHQICFHTEKSLTTLEFLGYDEVSNER